MITLDEQNQLPTQRIRHLHTYLIQLRGQGVLACVNRKDEIRQLARNVRLEQLDTGARTGELDRSSCGLWGAVSPVSGDVDLLSRDLPGMKYGK